MTSATSITLVKADYDSVCDDPLTNPLTESFTGLAVGGNTSLDITGDLEQTTAPIQVNGLTTLDVTGNICLVGGDCDVLPGTENDLNTLVIVNAVNAEILDANDLTINSANVATQLLLAAGNADATPNDGSDGQLTIAGNVTVGSQAGMTGQILLQGQRRRQSNRWRYRHAPTFRRGWPDH